MEVALESGTDPSTISVVIYNNNGTIRSTNSLDATPDNTIAGTDVYTVEAGLHQNGAVALVVDGVVVSFVSFNRAVTASEGPANGLTSTQIGTTANGESLVSTDMGSTYTVETNPTPGTIPCFLAGTLIETLDGPRPAETLNVGDLVITSEGPSPLAWIGTRRLSLQSGAQSRFAPVCVPRGALGQGLPFRDLFVSPSHRILISTPELELFFAENEVLMPARHLVGWNGVRIADEITDPTYVHLMFKRHALVRSNGAFTESFHPGQMAMSALEEESRREILRLFPALRDDLGNYGPTARKCLKAYESELAIRAAFVSAHIQSSQTAPYPI